MKPTPSSNADDIDKITVEIIWQYIANTIKSSLICNPDSWQVF